MKDFILLLLAILVVAVSCDRDKDRINDPKMSFSSLVSYAYKHAHDSIPRSSKVKEFNDFDFINFQPSNSQKTKDIKVQVYYNSDNDILKIGYYTARQDGYYEFRVITNKQKKTRIFYAEEFYDESESEYIGGFFITAKSECYFISFSNPICIMRLDEHLKPYESLRVTSKKIVYKTVINYESDSLLYSETYLKPLDQISVSDQSTLQDVIEHFSNENQFVFEKELVLGSSKGGAEDLPLWRYSGYQEYDTEARP